MARGAGARGGGRGGRTAGRGGRGGSGGNGGGGRGQAGAPSQAGPGPAAQLPTTDANASIVSRVVEAKAYLESLAPFSDIHRALPGDIAAGDGHMAAYDGESCATALKSLGKYIAGGNLWWVDLTSSLNMSSVPVNVASVERLEQDLFSEPPTVFPDNITVGVYEPADPSQTFGRLMRISPEETHTGQHLAFTPEKFVVPERGAPSGRTTETSVLKLHVRPLPGATDTSAPELFAASDTNPGLLAGSLAKRIETDGSTVVSGMGSHAVSKVLKALLVAETYLERRGKLDGKTIAATVRNEGMGDSLTTMVPLWRPGRLLAAMRPPRGRRGPAAALAAGLAAGALAACRAGAALAVGGRVVAAAPRQWSPRCCRAAGAAGEAADNASAPASTGDSPAAAPGAGQVEAFLRLCAASDRGQAGGPALRLSLEAAVAELEASSHSASVSRSPLLEGSWRLVYASEDPTRCSPFFWALRRRLAGVEDPNPLGRLLFGGGDVLENALAFTDSVPIKSVGVATQQLQAGRLLNQVVLRVLGAGESKMTTTCSYEADPSLPGALLVTVETTQVLGATLGSELLDLIRFPSGELLGESARVQMQVTYLDDMLRIVRDVARPSACFAFAREPE
ncbi:unnamed protein product [Prorocentrum cordatum]|uniref:Plastid lipid-associated protein/fibrillin conserved domain-containing protein n=1 Tax=Prorocentrum cordatum TaxID=2364126 RepID=A0ABN9WJP8_9DINO|nr:unnamed protein product [Polarella glacialis]